MEAKLTLPPGGIPRFASLHCVLQILGLLNSFSTSFLVKRYRNEKPDRECYLHLDGWNVTTLCGDAQISRADLEASTTLYWSPSADSTASEASKTLRFCPICLAGDFHTPIFQFPFVEHCPVHGDKLIDKCLDCGKAKPYTLSAIGRENFGCDCKRDRWNLLQSTEHRRAWMCDMDAELLDFLSWLTAARTAIAQSSCPPSRFVGMRMSFLQVVTGTDLERLVLTTRAVGAELTQPRTIDHFPIATEFSVEDRALIDGVRQVQITGIGAGGGKIDMKARFPTSTRVLPRYPGHI